MEKQEKEKGFTIAETMVTVAIVGILATAAVPAYQYYVAQAQVSESMEMMQGVKSKVEQSVIKSNSCIPSTGATEQGKYGVLTVSGAVKSTATQNPNTALKTGCVLSYKVNADSVSKSTAGKLVVGDLFNNGSISKSSSTTVEDRLLPKEFKTLMEGAITATGAPSAGANASIAVTPTPMITLPTTNNELTENLGSKPTTDSTSTSTSPPPTESTSSSSGTGSSIPLMNLRTAVFSYGLAFGETWMTDFKVFTLSNGESFQNRGLSGTLGFHIMVKPQNTLSTTSRYLIKIRCAYNCSDVTTIYSFVFKYKTSNQSLVLDPDNPYNAGKMGLNFVSEYWPIVGFSSFKQGNAIKPYDIADWPFDAFGANASTYHSMFEYFDYSIEPYYG